MTSGGSLTITRSRSSAMINQDRLDELSKDDGFLPLPQSNRKIWGYMQEPKWYDKHFGKRIRSSHISLLSLVSQRRCLSIQVASESLPETIWNQLLIWAFPRRCRAPLPVRIFSNIWIMTLAGRSYPINDFYNMAVEEVKDRMVIILSSPLTCQAERSVQRHGSWM